MAEVGLYKFDIWRRWVCICLISGGGSSVEVWCMAEIGLYRFDM